MKFRISNRWWRIVFRSRARRYGEDMGRCCNKKCTITVYRHPEDSQQEELDTILHELLHAVAWDHCEEWVSTSARDMAKLLYRLGWRKRNVSKE